MSILDPKFLHPRGAVGLVDADHVPVVVLAQH